MTNYECQIVESLRDIKIIPNVTETRHLSFVIWH